MSNSYHPFYWLHSRHTSVLIDCQDAKPSILYWGVRLHDDTTHQMVALLRTRQEAPASLAREVPLSFSPEFGAGFTGNAGLHAHRAGRCWDAVFALYAVDQVSGDTLLFRAKCDVTSVEMTHRIQLDVDSDVVVASTEVVNAGDETLSIEQCFAPLIPIPPHLTQLSSFTGRWANEFQQQRFTRFQGSFVRENRTGRTSHHSFPGLIMHSEYTSESAGDSIGLHLGWSGNHRLCVEERHDGRVCAQLGELFYPGELSLSPGEKYETPRLYGAFSARGLSHLSRCFHTYCRTHLLSKRVRDTPRPVHFNTWEALYFALDTQSLCELADAASEVGVERFVLDDGWFKNRDSDQTGLGDWVVDHRKFPHGLTPLIQHVHDRGMEFGLWVEPEMISPNSELFRAHPDWALGVKTAEPAMARNQLVLDLTRPDVQDYIVSSLDALLTQYPIRYLKWDMNRELSQPGDQFGRAASHRFTQAFYSVLDRVRRAHASVEIESCASGGGRADFGVLQRADRIWASDTNDALDRLLVQRGFSLFFPLEVMGAHVGPYECHITGRVLSMALRAGVAMFGHMGIEANLLDMSASDKTELSAAVRLHKRYRALIHRGELVRLDLPEYESGFGVVSPDKAEALFSYVLVNTLPHSLPGQMRFSALNPQATYRIRIVWPENPRSSSPSILDVLDGADFTGQVLMAMGVQLPILAPGSILVFDLKAISPGEQTPMLESDRTRV